MATSSLLPTGSGLGQTFSLLAPLVRPRTLQLQPRAFQLLCRTRTRTRTGTRCDQRALTISSRTRNATAPAKPAETEIDTRNQARTQTETETKGAGGALDIHSDPAVHDPATTASSKTYTRVPETNHQKQEYRKREQEESESASKEPRAKELSEIFRNLMRTVPHPVAVVTAVSPSPSPTFSSGPISSPSSSSSAPPANAAKWRGATVSSFNTVTFTPEPVVSFNIKQDSSTFRALSESGTFAITLLKNTREGALLASKFTKGNYPPPFVRSKRESNENGGTDLPQGHTDWSSHISEAESSDSSSVLSSDLTRTNNGLPPAVSNVTDLHKLVSSASESSTASSSSSVSAPAPAPASASASTFSVLCQLTNAVPAGDHVVVIARAVSVRIMCQKWGTYSPSILQYQHRGRDRDVESKRSTLKEEEEEKDAADTCLTYANGEYGSMTSLLN